MIIHPVIAKHVETEATSHKITATNKDALSHILGKYLYMLILSRKYATNRKDRNNITIYI